MPTNPDAKKLALQMTAGRTWSQRIADAEKCGVFTEADQRLAASNHSCSLGEATILATGCTFYMQDVISMYSIADPDGTCESYNSEQPRMADMTFYDAVCNQDVARARRLHKYIRKTVRQIAGNAKF